jgi:hypothetical protein
MGCIKETEEQKSWIMPEVDQLPIQEAPPDLFVSFFEGTPIESSEDWWEIRVPELKALLQPDCGFWALKTGKSGALGSGLGSSDCPGLGASVRDCWGGSGQRLNRRNRWGHQCTVSALVQ